MRAAISEFRAFGRTFSEKHLLSGRTFYPKAGFLGATFSLPLPG
jgi:hypothetical protein